MTAQGKITASAIARILDKGEQASVLVTDHQYGKGEVSADAGPDSSWYALNRKTVKGPNGAAATVLSYTTDRRPGDGMQHYVFTTNLGTIAHAPGAQTFWLAPVVDATAESTPAEQPTPADVFDPALVRIDRSRRSVTQGGVTLFYDGEQLGERGYHDEIVSCTDNSHTGNDAQTHNGAQCWGGAGNVAGYHGADDRYWLNVASALHAKRSGIDFTQTAGQPFNPGTGVQEGYVAGVCGHRVAQSEWKAGFRHCERWPGCTPDVTPVAAAVQVEDPNAARIAELEAERVKALAAMQANFDQPLHGRQRTKRFGQRVNAQLRRGGEHRRNIERIDRELAAARTQADKPAPVALDLARLPHAYAVRTDTGWYRVLKVNKVTVKVEVPPGWDDLIKISKILEIRERSLRIGDVVFDEEHNVQRVFDRIDDNGTGWFADGSYVSPHGRYRVVPAAAEPDPSDGDEWQGLADELGVQA